MIDDSQLRSDINRLEQNVIKNYNTCIWHQLEVFNSEYNDKISSLLAYREHLEIFTAIKEFDNKIEAELIQDKKNTNISNNTNNKKTSKKRQKILKKIKSLVVSFKEGLIG